jgi:cytochrome c oxidase assembly protein Cox11
MLRDELTTRPRTHIDKVAAEHPVSRSGSHVIQRALRRQDALNSAGLKESHQMTDVFVSYATADRSTAMSIVEALESQKLRVFWDRSIPAGKKWPDVLHHRLNDAQCVLVLLTRESLKSSWVTYEASVALQRRTLVPLLLDPDINPNRDLPEMYRDLHVASISPDRESLRTAGLQQPWVRAVRELVRQGTRRRLLLVGGTALLTLFVLLVAFYAAVTLHNSIVEWQAGIRYLERGPYSKAENERLKSAIRGATSIKLLVGNANSFASNFREDLAIFFKNRTNRMYVLVADPDSEFYKNMMTMTTKGIGQDSRAVAADEAKLYFSKRAILGVAGDSTDSVEFRQYETQFRLPMILVDKKYCFLTLRLTPDQAPESIRIELGSLSAGTPLEQTVALMLKSLGFLLSPSTEINPNIESCERHFNEVWMDSKRLTDAISP